jgi:ElaB/YqjD/DUF883 family membrane-anchored ribosome-binding protein
MASAKMSGNSGAANVGDKLRQTQEDLQADLHAVGTAASDLAQEKLEEARAVANEYYEQGRECVAEYSKSIETQIRENPLRALMIAAGVGVLAGFILKRR